MKTLKTVYCSSREEWRRWLERNHKIESEVWLIYYKKGSGRPRIPYDDAVEEALCFGWIDSLVKRIDDQKYAQKFTPRTNSAKWSEPNKKRARAMIEQGRMTDAGLAVIQEGVLAGPSHPKEELENTVPGFIQKALNANKKARTNFESMSPSRRRHYIRWITSPKRDDTQKSRLAEAITMLARDKDPGSALPEFIAKALNANRQARTNFNNLAPSYRRVYVNWITMAKREETRKKRLAEAIELLAQNKKLGLK